jgi:hypothetical protein
MQDITLRQNIKITIVAIATIIAFILVFLTAPKKGDTVIINCSISEISPDFTVEMREACRQVRADNILQKPK